VAKGNGVDSSRPAGIGANAASHLGALEQAVRALPAVDEARVAVLRAAMERGTYTISVERIVDRLIQLERALARGGSLEL
jgi:flagellar biosynthesis anti-sigma factor FlgM